MAIKTYAKGSNTKLSANFNPQSLIATGQDVALLHLSMTSS